MIRTKRDMTVIELFKAGVERGGCWLMVMLAGIVLMVALMSQQQKNQQIAIQQNALILGLQTLQETIATDISMGVEIEDNPRIEEMLVRMLQSNASLQGANVINPQGLIMYSTNRAELQTPLASQLVAAIDQQSSAPNWQLQWGDWWLIGIPINNAHAEKIGHIFLSKPNLAHHSSREQDTFFNSELATSLILSLAVCSAIGIGIILLLGVHARYLQRAFDPEMQSTLVLIQDAKNQIHQGLNDLDLLEQKE